MIPVNPKIRSAFKTHGGKSYLARDLVAMMPEHDDFADLYGGGGAVILNKPVARNGIEIFNDLDWFKANVFHVLKEDVGANALAMRFQNMPYEERLFLFAKSVVEDSRKSYLLDDLDPSRYPPLGDVELAAAYIVTSRFSRGGLGKDYAWSERKRGGQPGEINSWETFRHNALPTIAQRCRQGVEVLCIDGVAVLRILSLERNRRVLVYLDPPYLPETRSARDLYRLESTRTYHAEQLLPAVKAAHDAGIRVMLSGYHSDLYTDFFKLRETFTDWRIREFDMPNHSGQSAMKQRRTEVVYYNFELPPEAAERYSGGTSKGKRSGVERVAS